ncbi:hypothetical protein [Microseira sp. BLCC-F43]|jgi:hypothetical protein|uniref:hypothetical protein n=1 Tax=Microseira sp. BLCC-F43 TaxID=3153602 RepID=UPI0035BA9CF9
MDYIFSAANQALFAAGKLVQVTTNEQVLPILRDPITGRFVEIAKGMVSTSTQPLVSPVQFAMSGLEMYQNRRGFTATLNGINAIGSSIGVLQATTAVIGVGVAAGVALSAVNLWQTMKLREDVKQLRLEVKDGFIDLKKALRSEGAEIIQRIDEVAQDLKFAQHRLEFIKAYGRFVEATKLMKTAMSMQDINARKVELSNARQTLSEALSIYNNPHLLSETCAAGQLRRLECAWAIEQTIVISYQLQDEAAAVSESLSHLKAKIRQDALNVIDSCQTEDELDFIFPEIARIHDRDLAVLESWQNHIDWVRSLPPAELKLLESADFSNLEDMVNPNTNSATTAVTAPPEQLLYENLKQKSHTQSLLAQLKFMIKPELRREYESYVSQKAAIARYKTLVSSNLHQASNLTVANLYWYFKVRDESAVLA